MPNIGVKNLESATRRVVSRQSIGVLNILAFIDIFYLRKVSFDPEFKELIAWFFPKKEFVGGVFPVKERIFKGLEEVVYTEVYAEGRNSVTVKAPRESLLVSSIGESSQQDEEDLVGSVCFGVKMDLKRFPKWATYRNGTLILRLEDGREYRFPCAY